MTTIAIMPENPNAVPTTYRAVAGPRQSVGRTPGEALDAIAAPLAPDDAGTLVVVRHFRPERFFSAGERQRLDDLMARWRTARDGGAPLPAGDQAELEALVAAEIHAATRRAAALASEVVL